MKKHLLFLIIVLIGLSHTAIAQKMTVKDDVGNVLMEVNDEGSQGSIMLPSMGAAPGVTANKLYNVGGVLYWNGAAMSDGHSLNAADGAPVDALYVDNDGKVGIGITSPSEKLEIRDGSMVIRHNSNWGSLKFYSNIGKLWQLYPDESPNDQFVIGGTGPAGQGGWGYQTFNRNGTIKFGGETDWNMILEGDTGQLGVGTMTPSQKLEVNGGVKTTHTILGENGSAGYMDYHPGGGLRFFSQGPNASTRGYVGFWIRESDQGNELPAFYIKEDGNVGIGLLDPDAKLEVNGQVKITGGSPGAGKILTSDATGLATWQSAAGGNTLDAAYDQGGAGAGRTITADAGAVKIAGTGGLEVDANTVVGASTSSTETLSNTGFSLGGDDLFVAGTAGIEGNVYTDNAFITGATTSYSDGAITKSSGSALNVNLGGAAGDDFIVDTSTFIVESDNNRVGIGTATPKAALHIHSTPEPLKGQILLSAPTEESAGITLEEGNSLRGYLIYDYYNDEFVLQNFNDGSGGDLNLNPGGGYVGIGRSFMDPAYPLHMGSGAHVTTGGVWTDASSREYKENIRDLSLDDALTALKELTPSRFNYKVDREDECVGFIAEDVPELVATKDRKGLSPMDIVAVLTKVVQEQQEKIENLEARLSEKE